MGPIVLTLEYVESASSRLKNWSAPRLLDGAVVQQSFWEARMPASVALLGVPKGWVDENEWYWDFYVWKRRPRFRSATLLGWVSVDENAETRASVDSTEPRLHAYLFSQAGGPVSIHPVIVARPWLVAGFSGSVLLVGLILLAKRPPAMLMRIVGLMSALILGVALEPSLLLLGIQSSVFGLVLVAVAALLQRSLDRRHSHPSMVGDRSRDSAREIPITVAGSAPMPDLAGSDGSTVIRPRPGTTIDHVRKAEPSLAEPVEERGRSG